MLDTDKDDDDAKEEPEESDETETVPAGGTGAAQAARTRQRKMAGVGRMSPIIRAPRDNPSIRVHGKYRVRRYTADMRHTAHTLVAFALILGFTMSVVTLQMRSVRGMLLTQTEVKAR
jgi:hypothetical protein